MSARLKPAIAWAALAALSIALIAALEHFRLPAALLLGAMAAAVVFSAAGAVLRVPQSLFFAAQGVIGCMIARAFPTPVFAEMGHSWPVLAFGVVSVVTASTVLGWLLARWQVLPGSTAIWGSAPGAATAMVLMAEAYGADVRLVAFMQYLRVVIVAVVATLVARLWTSASGTPPAIDWFPAPAWPSLVATIAVIGVGAIAGRLFRIPAGPMLVPMVAGAVLQDTGQLTIELPPWLLALAYLMVGWGIGLRFTRAILVYAAKALPRLVLSIVCLVALCGGFAALLVAVVGVDPLTAYLATSPGGADSVAIISASSNKVNVAFVMAMQTARFLFVLLAGPWIARLVAGRMAKPAEAGWSARR
ncbi:MAG: AbrB family transcriptional regulator [Ancalomicrobiaceae bacterium]|nr:AbrB family transcriptional regulator [Ancalomicrobiaceae bacterium]